MTPPYGNAFRVTGIVEGNPPITEETEVPPLPSTLWVIYRLTDKSLMAYIL